MAGEADAEIAAVSDRRGWEAVRIRWIGRREGRVRELLDLIPRVADKRGFGQAVNRLKERVEAALAAADERLAAAERAAQRREAAVDVTLPGRRVPGGAIHPVIQISREIEEIFVRLGYTVAEGPEVESDRYNFELLNFPPDHPARDTQDTFFLEDGRLLRTHTSPVQIRTMLARRPPLRVIIPGRVYRHDNDLRHSPMFHQVEGLAVAEGIRFSDLKGTLEAFLHRLFSPETGVRLRPSFFPFTEPSCEVDITCPFCRGKGCATCSETGWMEILGAGMVDPRVLAGCGVDPDRYTGFAFGLGLDRVAMIRFGIPNIRLLFENDERLLRQAGIR
ncbi:MAG: phenylalanine--tRNA ligase subunit alpha [Acidobacteria bacterium]|nr:phenylalanine--tRNA ligase subunit alpha [Thermoanaerobaculia bacterium]MBP7812228.1 phenylalanine--tRNA ligase subunit alpha [Thermoanaerobaculia bacterium]NLN12273.1 phenylalanine--tRNA ligase subunit alpha [Acidobacteriota bacterium]